MLSNMKINILKVLFFVLSFFVLGQHIDAQEISPVIDYKEKKSYEIGGITITGAETRDRRCV